MRRRRSWNDFPSLPFQPTNNNKHNIINFILLFISLTFSSTHKRLRWRGEWKWDKPLLYFAHMYVICMSSVHWEGLKISRGRTSLCLVLLFFAIIVTECCCDVFRFHSTTRHYIERKYENCMNECIQIVFCFLFRSPQHNMK